MGAEKWRTLRQQNKIPVKTQTETKGGKKSGRGIRTSNKGDILFVAARNFFLDYIPDFMNLGDELILKFKWYSTSLQLYTHVFWARAATKLGGFEINKCLIK